MNVCVCVHQICENRSIYLGGYNVFPEFVSSLFVYIILSLSLLKNLKGVP